MATVSRLQNHLQRLYYQIVLWLFGSMQASGDLPGDVETLNKCEIVLPTIPTSDERQEAAANAEQLALGTRHLDEILRSQNKDPRQHKEERKRVIIEAIRESQEIAQETGVIVPWQDLARMTKTVSVNAPPAVPTDEDENTKVVDENSNSETKNENEEIEAVA